MSTTAVPLRPIAKGSLTRLWIGVAAVVLSAGGLAWAGLSGVEPSPAAFLTHNAKEAGVITTESGLQYKIVKDGTGASPTDADVALISYKGSLIDGTVFDQSDRVPMEVSRSIPGFSEALKKMKPGGEYKIWIPAALGYGDKEVGPIPGNSTLLFDVTLHEYKSRAEIMQMQQMMQQQGGIPGAPPPQ